MEVDRDSLLQRIGFLEAERNSLARKIVEMEPGCQLASRCHADREEIQEWVIDSAFDANETLDENSVKLHSDADFVPTELQFTIGDVHYIARLKGRYEIKELGS